MWNWPSPTKDQWKTQYNPPGDRASKKKKKNKNKVRWIADPSIPEKFKKITSLGRIIIGHRDKDGTVEYFQIDPTNK